MRRIFSDYMESIAANEDIVFVTGDLGYKDRKSTRLNSSHRT